MIEYVVLFFLIIGTVFIFVATIGLLKMPDVYLRMSASTIAGTLGVACILIAVAFHYGSLRMGLHVLGVIIFLLLTVPIGAHIIGRTSHKIGLKMWDKTVWDDLGDSNNKTESSNLPEEENNEK
ncbi:MAG: monovalent cation/H(+) antiporter subunit G [Bacteroidota bacterium]